jgi:deoxyribodipyrimidine photo-lyase
MIPINRYRINSLNICSISNGPIIYWMLRDQRVTDNWALIYAQHKALEQKVPLIVIVCIRPDLSKYSMLKRNLSFMLQGLQEVEEGLQQLHIPFILAIGKPVKEVIKLTNHLNAGLVVTDMSPLKTYQHWHRLLAESIQIPVHQVDAHNIVPVWQASSKQEYAAYTIRPKISRLLSQFITDFPQLIPHPYRLKTDFLPINWISIEKRTKTQVKGPSIIWIKPGEIAAKKAMRFFINNQLSSYSKNRNDPNLHSTSQLSPFLHFGQLSAQRVALSVHQSPAPEEDKEVFLEELIIRRELADNYCYYQPHYDSFLGFPQWAQKTLIEHQNDPRPFVYTLEQFAQASTHDDLWNAAQAQLISTGKMHGYLRMYWAKKILEWTPSPQIAQEITIYLNDLYSLDGRDPNGYTGIAWSIGGVHDRPWFNRAIFGQVRYMALGGMQRKFKVDQFIQRF